MSAKTKIVVLHMKELIYTGILVILAIFFLILLIKILSPDKKAGEVSEETNATIQTIPQFVPGIYTTQLILGAETVDIEVIVDDYNITSVRMVNPTDTLATMYPLLEPTLSSISQQLYTTQSLDSITYAPETKYTALVLTEAIRSSIEKAKLQETETASG